MKVGKASYGTAKKRFKIKDGNNIYRILPPLGEMADSGRWFKHYRVEWGYKNSEGHNKPFVDCFKQDWDTKEVIVSSLAKDRREAIKSKWTAACNALKANPADAGAKEVKEQMAKLMMQYNCDSKYHLNVVNEAGEIGMLKIGKTAMDGLQGEIKKLRERRLDPLGLTGVFFNFHREGTGLNTVYSVQPHRTMQDDGSEIIVKHTMDDAFIARLSAEAFELSNLYPTVTSEEVARIVKEGPIAVDEILGAPVKPSIPEEIVETVIPTVQEELVPEPVVEVKTDPAPTIEKLVEPVVEEAVIETPAPKEEMKVGNTDTLTMDDQEFLKSLGI